MAGKYVLHPAGNAQFHWDLTAGNEKAILSSQLYADKESAKSGIESCRSNSSNDERYVRLVSKSDQPYFILKADNGEIIGTSQMYSLASSRDQGIASCKTHGPSGVTEEEAAK